MEKTTKKRQLFAAILLLAAALLIAGLGTFTAISASAETVAETAAAAVAEEPEMNWFEAWLDDIKTTFHKCFIREDRYMLLVNGIGVTIKVSILSAAMGMVIGFFVAICNLSKYKALNLFGKVYTDIIRGTPSVTQLMIIYFVIFASVHWEKWIIASIAFAINSGAYVSEIIRSGINAVDRGQEEAGRSLGLNRVDTMRLIIMPQAIKNILPALGNEFIVLLKETSIAGYIAVHDLTKGGEIIKNNTYDGTALFLVALIILFL